MSHWINLRKRAQDQHKHLLAAAHGDYSATALIKAAEQITKVKPVPVPPEDPLLAGADAVLDSEVKIIWFNKDIDPELLVFYQMHEYSHFWLHIGRHDCRKTDFDAEAAEEESPFGVTRVEGYGPKEQSEREANVFAREVLLPTDLIKGWYLSEGLTATQIAKKTCLPEVMVYHQLSYALLVSDLSAASEESDAKNPQPALDSSQREVAEWLHSPLLVEAGPGTGKTRTLIGRIEFLMNQGIKPSAILALTFSNKAAEEMRSRIASVAPNQAPEIWMGTFHAFGLELLRKYGTEIGVPVDPPVLDPVDALFLLERNLPSIKLDRYQNLYDPTMHLRSILGAISRAKDELIGPSEYKAFAQMMRDSAVTKDDIDVAEKALEVARVYEFYQGHLDREGLLDFGDLIFKSVTVLRSHPDIRDALRNTYDHILVDEYQDVNRASGMLLREIAGNNAGLWVVGDTRQAIYRFRGASTANMRQFTTDFPAAKVKPLGFNYRSRPEVIKVFSAFAPKMEATKGQPFTEWQPKRAPAGRVDLNIADDLEAEAQGIAKEIDKGFNKGIQYKDQAILCRSHTALARFAGRLEQLGIPVLYLGDLFERQEIRDLLSLLSLVSEGNGNGLVRVAGFLEYKIAEEDIVTAIREAREKKIYFPAALELVVDSAISGNGKKAFGKLASHVKGISFRTAPWIFLVQYLFNRSRYLKPLLEDQTLAGKQKRLAIYQFLQFAHDQRIRSADKAEDPKRQFLDHIRRLEIHGEEKQLRQVPDWASGINAVRLLTVHASKGLEFEVVYLPYLGRGYFPAKKQSNVCPAPVGMLSEDCGDGHDEEEECLFYVALSRAREILCLSRANLYGAQSSNPSSLLESISGCFSKATNGPPNWKSKDERLSSSETAVPPAVQTYDVGELDTYMNCPQQYYYQSILKLSGKREDNAYLQFHKCVYEALRWLGNERSLGNIIDESTAHVKLKDMWQKSGPNEHPYESMYRRDAELMISQAVQRIAADRIFIEPPVCKIKVENGEIQFRPDSVEKDKDGAVRVRRIRTGRPSKSELTKEIYALYPAAVNQISQGKNISLEVMFLSTGDVQPIQLSSKTIATRLKHYNEAISGIQQKRFCPAPNDRTCPRCAHYFICPAPLQ